LARNCQVVGVEYFSESIQYSLNHVAVTFLLLHKFWR
jgi:hypothetical protein